MFVRGNAAVWKKGIAERAVVRIASGEPLPAELDWVSVEEPLEIRVSGEPLAITMRTPGDDARLAVGFLFSEGLIRSRDDLDAVAHCGRPGEEGYGNVIEITPASGVFLDLDQLEAARRGTLTTAACGVCGRRSIDDLLALCEVLPDGPEVPIGALLAAPARLAEVQQHFRRTGGTHAAAALNARGEILFGYEDIGRHNAVDKVIGALVYDRKAARPAPELPPGDAPAILAVSGRASFEIVQKAVAARLPIVASISAASSLAIDLADRARLTLATFVRDGKLNLHTHPSRVSGSARRCETKAWRLRPGAEAGSGLGDGRQP